MLSYPFQKKNSAKYFTKLSQNKSLKLTADMALANYTLYGKLGKNNLPAYGLRKTQMALRDSLESMPIATDCFELSTNNTKNIADSLFEMAMKLSKLRGWLNLCGA